VTTPKARNRFSSPACHASGAAVFDPLAAGGGVLLGAAWTMFARGVDSFDRLAVSGAAPGGLPMSRTAALAGDGERALAFEAATVGDDGTDAGATATTGADADASAAPCADAAVSVAVGDDSAVFGRGGGS
jgi:hypothetical protein